MLQRSKYIIPDRKHPASILYLWGETVTPESTSEDISAIHTKTLPWLCVWLQGIVVVVINMAASVWNTCSTDKLGITSSA